MTLAVQILFWLSLFLIVHSYGGYLIVPAFSRLLGGKKYSKPSYDQKLPTATLVIAAFNEETIIEEKINNSLQLSYPDHPLNIVVVTDGSNDRTFEIASNFPQITVFHKPERAGKIAAINRIMPLIDTDITIFTDANTFLNEDAAKQIGIWYQDKMVGGVAGKKTVAGSNNKDVSGEGEGIYWKYESFLKKMDSEFFSVVGAAGELYSIRTNLYTNPGVDAILDDFMISLRICEKGFRIGYDPTAIAVESPSASLQEEQKRKTRIAAGGFQSIQRLQGLLKFWLHWRLSYLYISHRFLRWAVCPFLLPLLLCANVYLAIAHVSSLYSYSLMAQVFFYFLALMGWSMSKSKTKFAPAYICYYFIFMNINMYQGLILFLKGKQTVIWDKAKRK